MGRVVVMNQITLDGVMQGPGRADEDTRDGFDRGDWAVPRSDETIVARTGRPLFPGGVQAELRLTDSVTTPTRVVIATYEPAEASRPGEFQ